MEMKNVIFALALTLLALNPAGVFAADVGQKQTEVKEIKFCPICGPEEETEGLAFSYKYKGKKYSFCSMDCMKEFKKNPEKYLENPGGQGHDHK